MQTAGAYKLLILDRYESHAIVGFDRFYIETRIILLYTPPHSSHLLQQLDVSCFAPLKYLYGQRVQEKIQKGIYSIGKEDFIHIYPAVHQQALSSSNIQSGFEATGLVPLSSERVLSKIQKTLSRRCRWPLTDVTMSAVGRWLFVLIAPIACFGCF